MRNNITGISYYEENSTKFSVTLPCMYALITIFIGTHIGDETSDVCMIFRAIYVI